MPVVQISVVAGRDAESLTRCAREVARTVHQTLGAPLPTIRVLVTEVPATLWMVGDVSRHEIDKGLKARPEAP